MKRDTSVFGRWFGTSANRYRLGDQLTHAARAALDNDPERLEKINQHSTGRNSIGKNGRVTREKEGGRKEGEIISKPSNLGPLFFYLNYPHQGQ